MHRTRTSFDDGWLVHEGDVSAVPHRVTMKAGDLAFLVPEHLTDEERAIPEETWQSVSVPHDWRIAHAPGADAAAPPGYPLPMQGFMPTGLAYYKKTFDLAAAAGEHVWLTFDGVQGFSDFWLNGFWLGNQATGYSPISFDITELLSDADGGSNVLLVRSDSREAEGWWYEGGGIYRHVWLETVQDVHVDRDGIYVTSPEATASGAVVRVAVEVANRGADAKSVSVALELSSPDGGSAAKADSSVAIASFGVERAEFELRVDAPRLWNIGEGNLYSAVVTLQVDGTIVDVAEQQFGIRTIEVAKDAVVVNGVRHKILGANIHQDFGGLGVALPDRICEAKLELLQEMGANTVRTAHHPPTPELVEHADRLGMLVIAENRVLSTTPTHLSHLRSLIKRFRSRPSIFLWSLGNEELGLEGTDLGERIMRRCRLEARALDPSRPTGNAGATKHDHPFHAVNDVICIQYGSLYQRLEEIVSYWPSKPYLQTEVGPYASSRGVYEPDDENARPCTTTKIGEILGPYITAEVIEIFPWVKDLNEDVPQQMTEVFTSQLTAGGCVWAGIDYLGEPSPARWPAVSASFGARDLIGLPKDYYWLLRAIFRPEPLVHAFPHWTWPGREGQSIPVWIYSNCEEVELLVNGEVQATVPVVNHAAVLEQGIVYQQGELVARGFRDGVAVAEHRQRTAGAAAALVFVADRTELACDGRDVVVARVAVVDADGVLVPDADSHITFTADGGSIIGVGNGDPACHEPHKADHRSAFKGWAAAVVQAGTTRGQLQITASADGLHPGRLTLPLSDAIRPHERRDVIDETTSPAGDHAVLTASGR